MYAIKLCVDFVGLGDRALAFHYMGTGTGHVGQLQQPDGSYHTTLWVMFFFIPLIPLRSIKVSSEDPSLDGVPLIYFKKRMVAQPLPMDWAHVRRVYTGVGVFVAVVVGLFIIGRSAG